MTETIDDYENTSDYQCLMDAAYLRRELSLLVTRLHDAETKAAGLLTEDKLTEFMELMEQGVQILEVHKSSLVCDHHNK